MVAFSSIVILCVCFVDRSLVFFWPCVVCSLLRYTDSDYPFGIFKPFDHCVVCSSSIYGFWLPLWPLCCLFFFDIRILITPLVSSTSRWLFVLCLLTMCCLFSSSIYGFWLPLWYLQTFWPLCCLFFFDIRILIASLAIVLSVLLRYTDSDYPFGVFYF